MPMIVCTLVERGHCLKYWWKQQADCRYGICPRLWGCTVTDLFMISKAKLTWIQSFHGLLGVCKGARRIGITTSIQNDEGMLYLITSTPLLSIKRNCVIVRWEVLCVLVSARTADWCNRICSSRRLLRFSRYWEHHLAHIYISLLCSTYSNLEIYFTMISCFTNLLFPWSHGSSDSRLLIPIFTSHSLDQIELPSGVLFSCEFPPVYWIGWSHVSRMFHSFNPRKEFW